MKNHLFALCMLFTVIVISCEKEIGTNSGIPPGTEDELRGVFIVNEGLFGAGNGTVSFRSSDGGFFSADLFQAVNNTSLGDVVQSMHIYNSKGYIIVNNSQKIEVVSMKDFKTISTITGFSSPRYFLAVNNNKGYVTDWFSNTVKIIDLNSHTISGSVPAGNGPEQMVVINNKVYVCNGGGFGLDSTVTVIDAVTNSVIKTIEVGVNPGSLVLDNNGKIQVLCTGSTGPDYIGGTADDIGSSIVTIDPISNTVISDVSLGQFDHPVKMVANNSGDKIYFLFGADGYSGSIKRYDITSGTIYNVSGTTDLFYGLAIHPVSGDIYAGRFGFNANCYMLHYNENSLLLDSVLVGIGPNSFSFN
jgi:YVTN family beta-propeller protein